MLLHFATPDREVLLKAAPRGAERIGDRDVDIVVRGLFTRVTRDCKGLIGNEQLDANVEQRIALLMVMGNFDDDRAADDLVGDATETFDPPTRGHFGGHAVGHASELNVDLHDRG